MSYAVPAVNVYQELATAGGVASTTPDLEGCIVGPAYQVLNYVAGNVASLVQTAATSPVTAAASILAGSKALTFAVIPPFTIGDALIITGAATGGGPLAANVTGAAGVVLTLDTAAGVAVTSAIVHKQGTIADPTINNTFSLPSQLPGQVIDTASIQVFANEALIETISTSFTGYAGSNILTFAASVGTGTSTVASAVITGVTNATQFVQGDAVSLAGAGVSGAALVGTILTISGTSFTLNVSAATAVTSAVLTKTTITNVSPTTNTLLIENGDAAALAYVDTVSGATVMNTSAMTVVSATGTLVTITVADVLPTTVAPATTASAPIAAGAASFSLTSATGFSVGDTIKIAGAGAGGADLETTIGSLAGSTISGLNPVTVTATTGSAVVMKRATLAYKSRKLFNNQLIPLTKPVSGGHNYDTSNTAINGTLTITPGPEIIYGKLISGSIFIPYKALRTDLSGSIMTINDATDNLGQFGVISADNPLALGVSVALANTTTRMRAIAIPSNDAQGYAAALELAQAERIYALAPLTQDLAIAQEFSLHCQQMSTPGNALWRTALVNTAIPTIMPVGTYTAEIVNVNSGNNTITLVNGQYILTSSNSTFISDNVVPGDTLNITAGTGSPSPIGTMTILTVVSNQQLVVQAAGVATGIGFFITRLLNKTQRAADVAATSTNFGSNRLVHIQPDVVVVNVNGVKTVLPGYYLCCAVAGLIAGMPSQQGFTNIAVAGISDLSNSNYVFTRAQLDTMAGAGTFIFVQDTSGGLPYVRHELTTDMSVYYYREMMAVRDWDWLSYYYHDILKVFIGKWNITPDTINIIRQTINAGTSFLKGKKLPKIGAPLIDATITSLAQDPNNVDQLNCVLSIKIPSTLNYLNLYLTI